MMNRKTKLKWQTLGATLLASTAVVTPLALVSCGNKNTQQTKIGDEYDREYGVDEATYKALKTTFWSKIKEKLEQNPLTNDSVYIERSRKALAKTFASIEEQGNLSYTAMSNAVINYAAKVYKIKLCRNKTANWLDVYRMFDGMKNSFDIYMLHCGLNDDQRNAIKNDATTQFYGYIEDPETGLKAKYDDPLSGLIEAKAYLFVCFADINSEIGLAAAANRLTQFLEDYTITFNAEASNNRLDQIENKLTAWDKEKGKAVTFKIGEDITPFMTTIFNVVRNKDGHVLQSGEFNRHLLPGYTISPILKNISRDPYANKYTLDVDWQCVKTNYIEKYPERVEATTAHIYKGDNALAKATQKNVDESKLTLNDLFPKDSISTVPYSILLTPEAQKQALYNAYFNPNFSSSTSNDFSSNYLEFKWDETVDPANPKTSYDAFFRGDKIQDESNATREVHNIEEADLAESGLMVAVKTKNATNEDVEYQRLDDFIVTNGKMTADKRVNNEGANQLLNKFLQNCHLSSEVVLTNIDTENHEATNTLFASYVNTDDVDLSTYQYNQTPIQTNGFPIGLGSYYFLTTRYNQLREYTNLYAENKYGEEHDNLKVELGLTATFFGITLLFQGICLAAIIVKETTAIWYFAILLTALASMALQGASFGIFIDHKWDISKEYDEKVNSFRKTQSCKDMITMLDNNASTFSLLKADVTRSIDNDAYIQHYNEYAKKPWPEVKAIIDTYQNIGNDTTYKAFEEATQESGISSEEYDDAMKGWKVGHQYWNETITFDSLSVGLDIANGVLIAKAAKRAPELAPLVQPPAALLKDAQEANIAGKLKDLEETKDIMNTNMTNFRLQKASKEISTGIIPCKNSPVRSNGIITDSELKFVQDIKETTYPLHPNKDPRTLQTNLMFDFFYGTKQTKIADETQDLVGEIGNNAWKLFKAKYGDPATGKNAIKNFFKYATTIGKDGKPGLTLGPETMFERFAIQSGLPGSPDFINENVKTVTALRSFDYDGLIPEEFLEQLANTLDPEKSIEMLNKLFDEIIPTKFPLSKFSDIFSKEANDCAGDILLNFAVVGPFWNKFGAALHDVWNSYKVMIKVGA